MRVLETGWRAARKGGGRAGTARRSAMHPAGLMLTRPATMPRRLPRRHAALIRLLEVRALIICYFEEYFAVNGAVGMLMIGKGIAIAR